MPRADTHALNAHLAETSLAVEPGAHAVVILDRVGWHASSTLEVPHNVTLMQLPPRSPELNPVATATHRDTIQHFNATEKLS